MSTYTQQKFNSFGDALSYALDIIKESPSDFSERTGIDKGRMSRYINNKTTPRPKTIKEIESLLGVLTKKRFPIIYPFVRLFMGKFQDIPISLFKQKKPQKYV